jgi:hypothetical protein
MNPGQLATAEFSNAVSETNQPGDAELAEGDRRLSAARQAFPGWDICPVIGGYLAVPTGTTLIRASTIDGTVAQLRRTSELGISLAAIIHLLQHHRHLDDALLHLLDMARVAILREMEE